MQSEKALILGLVVVMLSVGLLIGAVFLTYTPPTPSGENGGTPTTPNTIEKDTDLIDLALEVPNWNVLMSDDSLLSLSSLEGKFVIVDLMATWCSSCDFQNSNLETIYGDFDGDSLEIISLSVDVSETASMLANYMNTKGLPWPHGLDTNSVFTNYFSVSSIPTIVIIDDAGYFRMVHTGVWETDSLTATLALMMP